MGRGIKKISENVIADKRSLILATRSAADGAPALTEDVELFELVNTEAMPLGMLNADYSVRGLSVKVRQGDKDSDATWSKLDAQHTLIQQSIITNLLKDSAVTTAKIANQNVTTEKIKDQNVTTEKIKDQNVTTAKLKDLNVTTEKINTQAVTEDKLSGDMLGGNLCAVSTRTIRNLAVTTKKINDAAVTTVKIAPEAVTESKIYPFSVTTMKIKDSAVTEEKIENGAVTEFKIAERAVHAHNIAIGGVSNANLQEGCVSTEKIEDLAVTNPKIANETIVGSDKIVKNSITKDRLEPSVIDCLDRAVLHDGKGNVTGENGSTVIDNLTATGDIYARRVYNVVYMDIAEGYIPGEDLEPGDIVAMHEDGMVYKANSIRDCIVGVVSNEYASCFGASKEELLSKQKVAVGMIGQIHVKVKGPVRLGQRISISLSDPGVGVANWNNGYNIGQVLETIECDFDEIHEVLVQVRPM